MRCGGRGTGRGRDHRRNGKAEAYRLDVSDREGFARLAAGITEATGSIDILVNGAGVTVRRMIGEMGAEDWDRVIAVNLTGAFNGIRAVLPHMRRAAAAPSSTSPRSPGNGSRLGDRELFGVEGGTLGLSRHAAYELAPDHIRVNAVCPGATATAFGGAMPTAESKAERARKIPLGRMCEPEDIADPILFLASDAARMITGVALTVDGGLLIKNDTPYEEYFRPR